MRGRRLASSGIILLLLIATLVWAAVFSRPTPNFSVWFLDVGQGDSAYLRFPDGRDALVDGGPNKDVLSELGEVMPYWDHDLDLIILTHNHSDHLAGVVEVLERYEVKEVWISGALHTSDLYLNFLETMKEKGIQPKIVQTGYSKEFAGVGVEIIFPLDNWEGKRPNNQHDADVVSRFQYGQNSVLITGDLEEIQEQAILKSNQNIKADILKVPHHGSDNGLVKPFLEAVAPKVAVISVGKDNKYGHPGKLTMQLLKQYNIQVFRSDEEGRVGFTLDGKNYTKVTEH